MNGRFDVAAGDGVTVRNAGLCETHTILTGAFYNGGNKKNVERELEIANTLVFFGSVANNAGQEEAVACKVVLTPIDVAIFEARSRSAAYVFLTQTVELPRFVAGGAVAIGAMIGLGAKVDGAFDNVDTLPLIVMSRLPGVTVQSLVNGGSFAEMMFDGRLGICDIEHVIMPQEHLGDTPDPTKCSKDPFVVNWHDQQTRPWLTPWESMLWRWLWSLSIDTDTHRVTAFGRNAGTRDLVAQLLLFPDAGTGTEKDYISYFPHRTRNSGIMSPPSCRLLLDDFVLDSAGRNDAPLRLAFVHLVNKAVEFIEACDVVGVTFLDCKTANVVVMPASAGADACAGSL
jgi:hypothetical protein